MDDMAEEPETELLNEKLWQKVNEVNNAAQSHLAIVNDHINFTLQQAYFKCAYECFDRRKKQDEIGYCVEHCSVPVMEAQNFVVNEMEKFQETLHRSLRVCQDNYESAKLQPNNSGMKDFDSCIDLSVQHSINNIPQLARKLKAHLSLTD